MRVGGLASGIDTDSIIRDLMNAERIPLDKLEQDRTRLEWQRDAFREVNTQVAELERLITDMRLTSNTVNAKAVSSSMEHAITATGSAAASNGAYQIAVKQLAANAVNHGKASKEEINDFISNNHGEKVAFFTFDEAEGQMVERSFTIDEGDTIQSIVEKINDADDFIRAFYDEQSETLVMETTRSGEYNTADAFGGAEIGFSRGTGDFFISVFNMRHDKEQGGEDAVFYYNNENIELTSKDNRYTLNGMTFTFQDVTGTDANDNINFATLTVTNDVDAAVENITNFVDKYNELVETLNSLQNEPVYRDYPPLTDAQMEEMSDRQIEMWEEKARSGLLRREPILSSALTQYRSTWSMTVDNDGAFRMLSEIGITTTEDYLDGGKLEIDEDTLRKRLEEDAASVQQLLFSGSEGSEPGLLNRLEGSLEHTIDRINQRAGRGSYTSQMYTMGRQLEQMEERIAAFEDRLQQTEDRYWRQFSAMERAISMMNNQSAMLMSFGGNMYQ
jgi:flagellar hook-associated protein 2